MDVQLILVCLFILPPCPAALVKALVCSYKAAFIKREKEVFNATSYETVCFKVEPHYNEAVTMCNGKPLNPRCVCAYDMYILKVHDLCKFASGSNGSLNHVPIQFCKWYSYTKNGPCQNGGTLKDTGDLAIDAKCECKDGYSGDFCDTVDKSILCKPGLSEDLPACMSKFIAYPGHSSCSLTLGDQHFICDTQKNVTDGTMDCNTVNINASNVQGENNEPSGKSPLSGSPVLLVCLVVLLRRQVYGDVF